MRSKQRSTRRPARSTSSVPSWLRITPDGLLVNPALLRRTPRFDVTAGEVGATLFAIAERLAGRHVHEAVDVAMGRAIDSLTGAGHEQALEEILRAVDAERAA